MRHPWRPDFLSTARALSGAGERLTLGERFRGLRPLVLALLFFAAAAGLGVAHVTLRLRQLEIGYGLSRAVADQGALAEERRRLILEVETLKSPNRVVPAARSRLNLAPPDPARVRKEIP
jgi:cell division protein FtsL